MRNMLRITGVLAAVALYVFAIAGCAGGPNENQLKLLEETKAAALAAEKAQTDCESNKAKLESDLATAKDKLAKMKQEKAELAGEMSGHMFFADRYFGFDDATYASCRLLEILTKTGKKISELLSDVPKTFSTPEIRVECPDDKKFAVVKKAAEFFRTRYNTIDIDGVRVLFDDGWGLVRASNTQPALVLRFEAMSEDRLSEIRNLIESVLADIQKA